MQPENESLAYLKKQLSRIHVLLHDGVYGVHTGAGMSNLRFIKTVIELGLGDKLNVSPILMSTSNPHYNKEWFKSAREMILGAGGGLNPLDNATEGMETYGNDEHWLAAAASAHQALTTLFINDERSLLVSFDTPFVLLEKTLSSAGMRGEIFHTHIPRSTGLLHDASYAARLQIEKEAYSLLSTSENTALGTTSDFMEDHLIRDYGTNPERMVRIRNGVLMHGYKKYEREEIEESEAPLKLATGEKFVLAYGRAMPYKGFHILLEALRAMGDEAPQFIIIAAARNGENEYTLELQRLIQLYGLKGQLITTFDTELPLKLQQSERLAAVVVPSIQEPFGLIPIENFANPYSKAPVIVAAAGGLKEQVEHQYNGFHFVPEDSHDLATQIEKVLSMDPVERIAMKAAALRVVQERYDYEKNITLFLTTLVPLIAQWQE